MIVWMFVWMFVWMIVWIQTSFIKSSRNLGLPKYFTLCSRVMLAHRLFRMTKLTIYHHIWFSYYLSQHLHLKTQKSLLHLPGHFQLLWVSVQSHSTIYFLHPSMTIIHANMPIPPNEEKVYLDWKSHREFSLIKYWKHSGLFPKATWLILEAYGSHSWFYFPVLIWSKFI